MEKDLFLYFQTKALTINSLFQVEFDVTNRCNANCIFCFQGEHKKPQIELSTVEIKAILNDLRNMGVYSIGFSGGEPFCRDDFLDILQYARDLHFRISIITNAMLIDRKIIEKLNEISIERITISFHSIIPNNYSFLFGIKDKSNYDKVIDNIKYMVDLKMNIGIAVTVTKHNVNELSNIQHFFNELGITNVNISFNTLLQGKKQIDSLLPSYEEMMKQKSVFRLSEKALFDRKKDEIRCIAGRTSCSIDSSGNVYPCTFFNTPIGNLKRTSIKVLWETSHILKIIRSIKREHFEKCNTCEYINNCSICICDNLNHTGNAFIPAKKYCETRKARLKNV